MPDPGIARAAKLRLAAGILCVTLAAAAAGYVLLRRSGPSAEETRAAMRPAAPTAVPAPSAAEVPTPLPVVVVPPPPRVRAATADVEAEPVVPRPAAPRDPGIRRDSPPPTSSTASSSGAGPAPAAPHPPRPAAPASRIYAGSVTLAGGEKIELGGIAWSEEEPRALLNDRIVGVGGYVDGYSVSKIETDRVVLEKDGATIVLTVK